MRIISGNLKGSKLYITKNNTTRPLKDLVRESIFNLLTHSNEISLNIEQSNVLDLYAGTGSFGLECLSRKAKNVFFVENGMTAFKILEKNIEKLKLKKKTKIFFNQIGIKSIEIFFDKNLNFVKEMNLRGVPTTILINREGKEFGRIQGSIDFEDKEFKKWLLKQ